MRALWLLRVCGALVAALLGAGPVTASGADTDGSNWARYKQRFLSPEGRIVDTGNKNVSHSEGQGFGLLLAVAHDDRKAFELIWEWTRKNLGVRDDGLFAWRWDPSQVNRTGDRGNASDGDIVIAWAMARGGIRWKEARFREIAQRHARLIRARLLAEVGGETLLLPGHGWALEPDMTVLNLSYWVFPALQDLAALDPSPQWEGLIRSGFRLLDRARFGAWDLPADWMAMRHNGRLIAHDRYPFVFGYEAVRIPLYLLWSNFHDKEVLRAFQAYWAVNSRGNQIPTMVHLNSDRILQRENVLGVRAVNELLNCVISAEPSQLLSREISEYDDYYSSSLFLFAVQVAAERYPHCRSDSATAATAANCAQDAPAQMNCPLANPIPGRIARAAYAVRLVDVAQLPSTKARRPLAPVSNVAHAGDGSGRIFIAMRDGRVHVLSGGKLQTEPFLDIARQRGKQFLAPGDELGLAAIAFHPEFSRAGARGYGRLYSLHAEVPAKSGAPLLKGRAETEHHHSVVMEWRVDPAHADRADPAYRRELLRVAQPAQGRNAAFLGFDPTAKPGSTDFGLLYVGLGDGGPTIPRRYADSRESQDLRSPLGKLLRIDPNPSHSGPGYRVPPGNPYAGPGRSALREIWAAGLRHPGRISWDRAAPGRMLLPDAGGIVQEINLGEAGRNYGWNSREGTFVVDPGDTRRLLPLPRGEAERDFAFPVLQFDRDEGAAVVGGEVYRGLAVPALAGKYLFADNRSGRFFVASAEGLRQGRVSEIEEVGVLHNGLISPFLRLLGGDDQADVVIGADESGEIYVVSGRDGMIRKVAPDPLDASGRK